MSLSVLLANPRQKVNREFLIATVATFARNTLAGGPFNSIAVPWFKCIDPCSRHRTPTLNEVAGHVAATI